MSNFEILFLKVKLASITIICYMESLQVFPNRHGFILPVYDKASKMFDCDSLRDYRDETLTIRLPGRMDISEVSLLVCSLSL